MGHWMHQRPTSFWMTWDLRGHLFREALWLKQLDCRNPRGNDRFRGAATAVAVAACRTCRLNSSGRIWENRPFLYPQMFDAKNPSKIHQDPINLSESAQIARFFHDFSRNWKKGFWPSCDSWRPRPGSDATLLGHSNDLIPEILTLQLYLHIFTYIYIYNSIYRATMHIYI